MDRRLKFAQLYVILDAGVCSYDKLFTVLKQGVATGVDIVQLRDKYGAPKDTLKFLKKAKSYLKGKVPIIANDRLDLAMLSDVDGLHVGQDDIDLLDARRILGKKKIIGVSAQSLAHAKKAQNNGADYIGFGSVFKTKTKPERDPMNLALLKRIAKTIEIPTFAIGGIALNNIEIVLDCGITRVAICRDICLAKNVKNTVAQFKKQLAS